MQKTIRIMIIVATVLIGLSLLLLVGSMLLQGTIIRECFQSSDGGVLSQIPKFPWIPFCTGLLQAGCTALLIICCGNKKGGIWLELVALLGLAVGVPLFSNVANSLCTYFVSRLSGVDATVAVSFVNSISSYCMIPAQLGVKIAYVSCGMSIAFKSLYKRECIKE